ncbi:MAG TPA: efflux RND transporter periplasmic adaptor subunit [Pseudosphingobacterium sp.]|nr:efflux RND transporter periplasmic adaptor subunit [Pseudosphingobacterium sp.]
MKKYLIAPLLFVLLIVSCKDKVETFQVKEQLINEAVYASGQIMPATYYFLKPAITDRLLQLAVHEGEEVRKGQILAILGTPSAHNQLTILRKQVSLAQENVSKKSPSLNELKNRIRFLKEKYRHDSLNATRYKELANIKAVSQKDADQASIEAQNSLTEYESFLQQYKTQKNELNDRVLIAKEQLAQFSQQRERNVLNSPITGIVYHINADEGELVQASEAIMMVGSQRAFKLELLLDERDISKIKVGQKVLFETDAYEGRQFKALVSKIDPVSQKETRSFRVEATVATTERFFPQSTIEANILIREQSKALTIPIDYLIGSDSVKLQNGENIQKIKIVPGYRNGNIQEVKSGLHTGDILIKPIK